MTSDASAAPGAWTEFLPPGDPVTELMAGGNPDVIPSMPICQDVPSLPFQYQRIVEHWADRIAGSGGDGVEVTWEDYLAVRVAVYEEIFAHYTPAPSWFALPVQPTRFGIAGSRIERRGAELVHVTRGGREIPMGRLGGTTSESILDGTAPLERTWDSTLGFRSFKENEAWEPEPNRIERFRQGERFSFERRPDPEALGAGDCFDPEGWIPRAAFGDLGRAVPSADALLRAGCFDVTTAVLERIGWSQPPVAGCTSPFQNACYELGFEGLMVAMLTEPELVHQATAIYLPKPSPRHEAMKRSGIGIVYMYKMLGGGDLFGPRQFERFVMPVVQQALDFWHARGFWVVYYPMGNATPHLEPMRDLDWDALSLEESRKGYTIDIGEVRRTMGPDRLLFGNVATILIEQGGRDALIAEARRQIAAVAGNGRFILSCGTPIIPGTPADRVKLFCELPELI